MLPRSTTPNITAAVINDILDFSKIEAGRLDIESTDFTLDDVISSVTTLTAQQAHDKGLEFLVHAAPGVPEHLLGDPVRLGQILTNCIGNAVKFTERGEIRVDIQPVERTGQKVQLKCSVRDTGIGMTRSSPPGCFQPFTQADMSTTRKHGGTGLGLTICRRLVEMMGGRISLESEPGVGTTFYFTVWLGVGEEKGSRKVPAETGATASARCRRQRCGARNCASRSTPSRSGWTSPSPARTRSPRFVSAIRATLRHRVHGLANARHGRPPASRHIKSDETLSHQPAIVIVTAFGREDVREEERLQLDGFLIKPITRSTIVDTLVSVFAEPGSDTHASPDREQEKPISGARILLAEDNEINRRLPSSSSKVPEPSRSLTTVAKQSRSCRTGHSRRRSIWC